MSQVTIASPGRSRKSAKTAILLQCIPSIGAASCVLNGASGQHLTILPLFLWWSVLGWGFGYLYLGKSARFLLVLLLGPVLAIGGCFASFHGVTYDFEHCPTVLAPGYDCNGLSSADQSSVGTGLIVAAGVLILAVDAWRLAEAHNLALDAPEGSGGEPVQSAE